MTGQPKSPMLVLDRIEKQYDTSSEKVLYDLSLEVAAGESIAVAGPSGSGKSTLLNIIAALDRPTSGRVLLDSVDLSHCDDHEQAIIRNRDVGLVFQSHHLLPQCTALENVVVPTLAHRDRSVRTGAKKRAQELLDRVALGHLADRRPPQLSGGERQRVAVARALINRPKLLLADEPTGSLDRVASVQIAELLRELNEAEGVTMLVVTHATEVAQHMKRTLELRDGHLIPNGGLA